MDKRICIYTFYRFKTLINLKSIKEKLYIVSKDRFIFGTILIAKEGVNGSISGTENSINSFISELKKIIKIRKLNIKISHNHFVPFYRLKIRLKKEIVNIGDKTINPERLTGKHVHPKDWDKIISNNTHIIIDTRNDYEIDIGKFKKSRNPKTKSFKDFKRYIAESNFDKDLPIAMYCTGGIRCEKASSYLMKNGYKDVSQLSGGILNYFEYKKNKDKSNWEGECFVFDNRVAVNNDLKKGKYDQCYGCRHPITNEDKKSIYYVKGATCPHCYKKKSRKKILGSITRQSQIDKAESKSEYHNFMKRK